MPDPRLEELAVEVRKLIVRATQAEARVEELRGKVLEAREQRDEARAEANRHLTQLQYVEQGEDRTDALIDRATQAEAARDEALAELAHEVQDCESLREGLTQAEAALEKGARDLRHLNGSGGGLDTAALQATISQIADELARAALQSEKE